MDINDSKENQNESTNSKIRVIAYWTATAIIAFVMLSGGISNLMHYSGNVEGVVDKLGYPLYFLTILGVWKTLGGIAILVPRFPLLKEWAYAGIFFELSGAAVSHLAAGSEAIELVAPLLFAGIAVASWTLRPSSRRLR